LFKRSQPTPTYTSQLRAPRYIARVITFHMTTTWVAPSTPSWWQRYDANILGVPAVVRVVTRPLDVEASSFTPLLNYHMVQRMLLHPHRLPQQQADDRHFSIVKLLVTLMALQAIPAVVTASKGKVARKSGFICRQSHCQGLWQYGGYRRSEHCFIFFSFYIQTTSGQSRTKADCWKVSQLRRNLGIHLRVLAVNNLIAIATPDRTALLGLVRVVRSGIG